ncbi:MAG: RraA family protein [Deltaproteobacteria bacterium]|nr:RraA family protein [Deltaproteobacteria bacterium]
MTTATNGNALTGKVPAEAVHQLQRRPSEELLGRLRVLTDPTGTVSDALDEFGIRGALLASDFRPTIADACVVGAAITVRNVVQRSEPFVLASRRESRLAEIEGHNQARPGDVLVIQGVAGVSNMGGISATIASRQGELGAVVDGGIRDVSRSRELGFPVWAREVSPITGKWRIETVEVNGSVEIGGVRVSPGDVVVADSTGVCFIPLDALESVVTRCEEIVDGERQRHADIASGISVPELANRTYVYQYSVDREPEDTATREASKP